MKKILLNLILIVALCVPASKAYRGDDLNLTDEQKAQLKEMWIEAGDFAWDYPD
jgi:hypothetical protein